MLKIVLILVGVGTALYTVGVVLAALIEGHGPAPTACARERMIAMGWTEFEGTFDENAFGEPFAPGGDPHST